MAKENEYKIKVQSRKVIENRLLTTLAGGKQVAILATKEDLEIFIIALERYLVAIPERSNRFEQVKSLLNGAETLMEKAPW